MSAEIKKRLSRIFIEWKHTIDLMMLENGIGFRSGIQARHLDFNSSSWLHATAFRNDSEKLFIIQLHYDDDFNTEVDLNVK